MSYKPTIGLEIHAELKTKTKMFCGSLNDPNETRPNVNICPICMGHPGTLPFINGEAVKLVVLAGMALNCQIARHTFFERKNYFYPDLPKGYQISQFQKPLCENGYLEVGNPSISPGLKRIRIKRIHLEEDAGKLIHPEGKNYTLADYNRAGVPLLELVTEPDFTSGEEVKKFAEELRKIFRYLKVSDADMEKGQMRVEVNISVRDKQQETSNKFGTKVEIKNLNSIKAAANSVDYEIKRQSEALEAGEEIKQETRGWDDAKQKTFSQRSKEESHDYRYFPEPDLPSLNLDDSFLEEVKSRLTELPAQRRERFKKQYGLNDSQIEIFTIAKHLGDFYERVASELGDSPKLFTLAANYIITEFPPLLNMQGKEIDDIKGIKIDAEGFAQLMIMISEGKLSSTGGKAVLKKMAETGIHPEEIVRQYNLEQISDMDQLNEIVMEVIVQNPKPVNDYKKGKEESINFLVGKVMQKTYGRASTSIVAGILKKELKIK